MCEVTTAQPFESGAGRPVIVAVCGKGGAGKTTVSAAVVRALLEDPTHRVLAIDADPAAGLASALGIEVRRTVDDIRSDLIRQVETGRGGDTKEMVAKLDYQVFEAVSEQRNLAFLAIGRPEKEGCYCQVNDLLRDIIATFADGFDAVVIDGEAGVEQINRRVMEHVTHLLAVSDASARGITVAKTIRDIAQSAVRYEKAGLVLNRIRGEDEVAKLAIPEDLECLGWIPEDDVVRRAGLEGECLLDVPEGAFLRAVRGCLSRFGIHTVTREAAAG